jgi:superfamily II DNA or RNA helicase
MFSFNNEKFENVLKDINDDIQDIKEIGQNAIKIIKRKNANYTDSIMDYMTSTLIKNPMSLNKNMIKIIESIKNHKNYDNALNEIKDYFYIENYKGLYELSLYIFNNSIDFINNSDDFDVIDNISNSDDINSDYSTEEQNDDNNILSMKDNFMPEYSNFKGFCENQKEAIKMTLNSCKKQGNFILPEISHIHCQATGSGKTFIGLNLIHEISKLNNFNSEMTILWFTERKSIMMDLFLKKLDNPSKKNNNISPNYDFNTKNIQMWKHNDIIDLDKFEFMEFVDNKDSKWYDKINNNTNKPKLIIMNRTYLTMNDAYEKIKKNVPILMIHDECHSAINKTTTKFYKYSKTNWKSKIIGFSATPLRAGRTNKKDNSDILCELFNNPDTNNLAIFTNFNTNSAISSNVIVKPKFVINKLTQKIDLESKEISDKDAKIIMERLNNSYSELVYGKMVGWCRTIKNCKKMKEMFDKYHNMKDNNGIYIYPNLHDVNSYIDHSETDSEDYLNFYKLYSDDNKLVELEKKYYKKYDDIKKAKDKVIEKYEEYILEELVENKKHKGILFCAEKHREGSDIPFLDSCVFLDGCINRSSHVFIQCVGRVLRKDKYKKKECGLIIDFYSNDKGESDELVIARKLIWYYLELENVGLNKEDALERINQYMEMTKKIDLSKCKETQQVEIKIDNDNSIIFKCDTIRWDNFGNVFDSLLMKKLCFMEKDKFIAIKNKVAKYKFYDDTEYIEKHKKYDLPENPKEEFKQYWNGWIDFLSIDTSKYFTLKQWDKYILDKKIKSISEYKLESKKNKHLLPSIPEEFYKNQNFENLVQRIKNLNGSDKEDIY